MATSSFTRLVRFTPKYQPGKILLGQPVDEEIDVGAFVRAGKDVLVSVFSGTSVLDYGVKTSQMEYIDTLLSPLAQGEVGTIRCIGLNYVQHAKEVNLTIPEIPTLFLKPDTALANPWPEPYLIPKPKLAQDSTDYESELVIVIGSTAKNVSEADAMKHVLGYTAANDISSRQSQFAQSQWCFSKGFDGACPIGPVLVSTTTIPDPSNLRLRGLKNGKVLQDCTLDDLIFSVPKIVSFCSQDTTLKPGTLILTGTPAGVGHSYSPKEYLNDGDEFAVELLPSVGTLFTKFVGSVGEEK